MAKNLDLARVTTPVLLHLLQDEIRFPRLFLVRCKLTSKRFKATIDPRFPAELVELAALPLWVDINLKAKVGRAKAFEIMRVALLTGGVAQWNLQFRTIAKPRTFANLCDQEVEVNKTGFTRWNTMRVVERGRRRLEPTRPRGHVRREGARDRSVLTNAPLIRYEMSDRVALRGGGCPCGKPYRLVREILARTEDTLVLRGTQGETVTVHPNVFHDVLDAAPLRGWQVLEEEGSIRLQIAAAESDSVPSDLAARLRAALQAHGAAVDVTLERVADVTRTGVGKALVVRRTQAPPAARST